MGIASPGALQPPRMSQSTKLEREAHFVVGTTALFGLLKIKFIKGVMLMQAGSVHRKIKKSGLLPLCQNVSSWQIMSLLVKWLKGTIIEPVKTSHYDRSNHTSSIGTENTPSDKARGDLCTGLYIRPILRTPDS